jgi:hypothetical protein
MACDMESASTSHRALLEARGLKRFVVEQVPQPLRSRSSRARGFAAYDAKDAQVGVYSTAEEAIAALAGHPGPAKREAARDADDHDAGPAAAAAVICNATPKGTAQNQPFDLFAGR